MSAYTPADSDDGTSFVVSKTTDVSVINSIVMAQSGTMYKMKATSVTTVVEFRGLSRSDALSMADSADYNYCDKHGVRYNSTDAWMAVAECEGTECKADAKRMNEADMWRVTVTYVETSVSANTPSTWTRSTF